MAGELVRSDMTHGYYEFDGQVAGQILDKSSNGLDPITVIGAIDVLGGKFSNGLRFDGVNDTSTIPNTKFADLTNQLGLFFWVKLLRTGTGADGIVMKGTNGGTGQDIFIYQLNDQNCHYRINDGGDSANKNLGITDFKLVVANYDGSFAELSIDNGSLTGTAKTGTLRNTEEVTIGSQQTGIANCSMIISQLGFRNAPFTTDEIAFLWRSW